MPSRFSGSVITVAMAAAGAVLSAPITSMRAQAPTASGQALKTPRGEPDLQGIWTDEFDTPLQRQERSALLGRRATERNLAGGYNFALFLTTKRTGARTSRIVDPADGRIPPLTAEAQKAAAADREFRLALLQATDTCKNKSVRCSSGTYDPMPSPRRAEPPPRYNATDFGRLNRHDGPEDGALADHCLTGELPEFGTAFGGSFRRIVQTPGGVSIFYDVGQEEGCQRNIVMNGTPPPVGQHPRVVWRLAWPLGGPFDVTNFGPKTDYQGSRENLHLIERWTRTGPTSLEHVVTIEDPTVWTRP
jgi:hypothetical protein